MTQEPPQVDNTALVAKLEGAVTTQEVTAELLRHIAAAELYVPLTTVEGDTQPSLPVVEHEGHFLVAAYTSLETLGAGAPDAEAVTVVAGGDLAQMLVADDQPVLLALDTGGNGIAVEPADVLEAARDDDVPDDQPRIYLGVPADPPQELMRSIAAALGTQPDVISAHLLQAVTEHPAPATPSPTTIPRDPELSLLIGIVVVETADDDAVLDALGPAIGEPEQPVDVMLLPETAPPVEDDPGPALRRTPAFYRRSDKTR